MNILTAYFSYTEHTRGIAKQVKSLTGGDLFEIRPAVDWAISPPMSKSWLPARK